MKITLYLITINLYFQMKIQLQNLENIKNK
jgi:hypothetical protein